MKRAKEFRLKEKTKSTTSIIYGGTWTDFAANYLKCNPLCKHCGRAAEQVDHIIPLRVNPNLKLAWDNCQGLCGRCHRKKTKMDKIKYPPN